MTTISPIQSISTLPADIENHEIRGDRDLLRALNELLGKEPRPQHIARLINTIRTKGQITSSSATNILELRRLPSDSDWMNKLLTILNDWLIKNKKIPIVQDASTQGVGVEQGNPQELREGSAAALLAATSVDVPANEGSNFHHAKKMLEFASIVPPGTLPECWEAWKTESQNWEIDSHVYHSQLVGDAFSASPHVKNVFIFKKKDTSVTVKMGPDDAKGLFPSIGNEIDNKLDEKIKVRRTYVTKADCISKLANLTGSNSAPLKELMSNFNSIDKIGDTEFVAIDKAYDSICTLWDAKYGQGSTPLQYFTASENMLYLFKEIFRKDKKLDIIQTDVARLEGLVNGYEAGTLPANRGDIDFIIGKYNQLLDFQKTLKRNDGTLAHGIRVAEPKNLIYARPRGQSGIFVANFLHSKYPLNTGDIVVDFCGNGILHSISSELTPGSPLATSIIDMERFEDSSLFPGNPNPSKTLVSISGGTLRIAEGHNLEPKSAKVMIQNFTLHNSTDEQIKDAVLTAKTILTSPPQGMSSNVVNYETLKNYSLLVITLPDACRLEESPLFNALLSSGFRLGMSFKGINKIDNDALSTIRTEAGSSVSQGVKARVTKPYAVYVFANCSDKYLEYVRQMKPEAFKLNRTPSGMSSGENNTDNNAVLTLEPGLLEKLDATSSLTATNIVISSDRITSVKDLISDTSLETFEDSLALLIKHHQTLPTKVKEKLDEVVNLLDKRFVSSLPQNLIELILQAPSQISIPRTSLPGNVQRILPQNETVLLSELLIAERTIRRSTTGAKSLSDEIRETICERLKKEMKVRYDMVLPALKECNATSRDITAYANELRATLKSATMSHWLCLMGGRPTSPFQIKEDSFVHKAVFTHTPTGGRIVVAPAWITTNQELLDMYSPQCRDTKEKFQLLVANNNLTTRGSVVAIQHLVFSSSSDLYAERVRGMGMEGQAVMGTRLPDDFINHLNSSNERNKAHAVIISRALEIDPELFLGCPLKSD